MYLPSSLLHCLPSSLPIFLTHSLIHPVTPFIPPLPYPSLPHSLNHPSLPSSFPPSTHHCSLCSSLSGSFDPFLPLSLPHHCFPSSLAVTLHTLSLTDSIPSSLSQCFPSTMPTASLTTSLLHCLPHFPLPVVPPPPA